ncbi:unnamed protein product [Allacma fusca]|uniref:Uncharacterized protein n=1 Tax=Allacma fusca TaxID=39272 RepID=A0A8J2PWV7_9HEXA|nr:unnamed protein product [Allacma fusca]
MSIRIKEHFQSLCHRDIAAFSNQLFQIRKAYNQHQDYPGAKGLALVYLIRSLQTILLCIAMPSRIQFWYSTLDPDRKTVWMYCVHCLFNTQVAGMQFSVLFLSISLISYPSTLEAILLQDKLDSAGDALTHRKLLFYRKAQVLSIHFQSVEGKSISYITICCPLLGVIHSFGSIRYYDTLDMRAYLHMPLSLFITVFFSWSLYSKIGHQPVLSQNTRTRYFRYSDLPNITLHSFSDHKVVNCNEYINLFKINCCS